MSSLAVALREGSSSHICITIGNYWLHTVNRVFFLHVYCHQGYMVLGSTPSASAAEALVSSTHPSGGGGVE
ncbi:hypothetical protein CLOM_g8122 [Closterium sp. NIES-68]|nr:hypothetical protein CLOM_g8122 [Closterium sp. NIES-68]